MRALCWVSRTVGWLLILAAVAAFGRDVFGWLDTGQWDSKLVGELWYELHRDSLQLLQPAIERYVLPALWSYVIFPILLAPAWLVFAVPGIVLLLLPRVCHRRRATFRARS